MRIAIIGCGYVGLVASACFARLGHQVACVDHDQKRIDMLRSGTIPIYEPGLHEIVAQGVIDGRLRFGTDLPKAVSSASAVFIAVGTPDGGDDGRPDLTNVFSVAREVAAALVDFTVVVTKSTVPVGTGDILDDIMAEIAPRELYAVVSNPEFLREGRAIYDFSHPDRIVVGADSDQACAVMAEIYGPESFPAVPVIFTRRRTAELMKYASNAFLASKIAFVNEISDLCESVDADIDDLTRGMGLDARIGREFLRAGPGYGGSCLPKDTRALARMAKDHGSPRGMFEAIVQANSGRKDRLAARIVDACGGSVKGKIISLLGLTFKANTDDMRESPALPLIAALKPLGAKIRAFDPAGMRNAARMVRDVVFAKDANACIKGAHAVVLVTEWEEFRNLDFAQFKRRTAVPLLIDLRNIYEPVDMVAQGITYVSIGRPCMRPAPSSLTATREPLVEVHAAPTITAVDLVRRAPAAFPLREVLGEARR